VNQRFAALSFFILNILKINTKQKKIIKKKAPHTRKCIGLDFGVGNAATRALSLTGQSWYFWPLDLYSVFSLASAMQIMVLLSAVMAIFNNFRPPSWPVSLPISYIMIFSGHHIPPCYEVIYLQKLHDFRLAG